MTNKQELLMSTLTLFYRNPENLKKFLMIVNGQSKISLRLIDWFVTNYSKKENVMFPVESADNTNQTQFIVHTNYKSQLRAYSKRHFDPFCRGENIDFCYENSFKEQNSDTTRGKEENFVETTVGQLNFFRWIISKGILEHVETNFSDIEKDMTRSMKSASQATSAKENDKPQRKQLSISATRTMLKHEIQMVVDFGA